MAKEAASKLDSKCKWFLLIAILYLPLEGKAKKSPTITFKFVTEKTASHIYKDIKDIVGIQETLDTEGIVIVKNVYTRNQIFKMEQAWNQFMKSFHKRVDFVSSKTKYEDCPLHFKKYDVFRYPVYKCADFIAYKLGSGRFEILIKRFPNTLLSEQHLNPESLKFFLNKHFHFSNKLEHSSPYVSFYGLLPSEPGNKDGHIHRDTTPLEPSDIGGEISVKFKKAFYITAITPLIEDKGSTGFILRSHRMQAQDISKALKKSNVIPVSPALNKGDIKLFDGRIVHRGLAAPKSSTSRKAFFSIHHRDWYKEY